jgi:hypothetical protein
MSENKWSPHAKRIGICGELCNAIYSDEIGITSQLQTCFESDVRSKFFSLPHAISDTQAIAIRFEETVFLVFRGSESPLDWLTNSNFNQRPAFGAHVHSGFYEATEWIYPQLRAVLTELGADEAGVQLVVSGHSLGGAMAVMFSAFLMSKEARKPDLLVTFGQPSCGNRQFMDWFGSLEIPYFRCVNDGDLVPTVPPSWRTHYWGHPGVGILFSDKAFAEKEMKTDLIPLIVYSLLIGVGLLLERFGRPEFKEKQISKMLIASLTDRHSRALYRDRAKQIT